MQTALTPGLLASSLLALASCAAGPPAVTSAFYPMDTAFMPAARADPAVFGAHFDHLKGLGFEHYGWRIEGIERAVPEGRQRDLELVAVYVTTSIDQSEVPANIIACMDAMAGTGGTLWLALRSETHGASATAGDQSALAFLGKASDLARARGLRVAVYPHTNFWLERYADAVRIVRALDRPDVGATFNLCHWLKVEKDADPLPVLATSLSELVLVTVNGADIGGENWSQLIQPLDAGTYDVGAFVRALAALGYDGPIGLQGYGVPGDPQRNLERAWAEWQRMTEPARE
jgi:sugar phosphate isomerase/epimerase